MNNKQPTPPQPSQEMSEYDLDNWFPMLINSRRAKYSLLGYFWEDSGTSLDTLELSLLYAKYPNAKRAINYEKMHADLGIKK